MFTVPALPTVHRVDLVPAGMSDQELFTPSEEESDSRGSYETPIRYKDYVGLSKSSSAVKRRCYSPLVLQTSCSSGEDDYPSLSKPKTDQRKSQVNGCHRSQVLGSKVLAPVNAPKSGVEDKENESAGTQSLAGIEKALLETNKLLKGVLNHVDKCEKQIRSFESKLEESASSTSVGSTPSRKKVQIPEEVRVRVYAWCICAMALLVTLPQKVGKGLVFP